MKGYKKGNGGDAGCVKQASEEKVQLAKTGSGKYTTGSNAETLKKRTDSLAKAVK